MDYNGCMFDARRTFFNVLNQILVGVNVIHHANKLQGPLLLVSFAQSTPYRLMCVPDTPALLVTPSLYGLCEPRFQVVLVP